MQSKPPSHVYKIRRRKDRRDVDLISDRLPFGRLWYGEPDAVTRRNAERYWNIKPIRTAKVVTMVAR
jgi:hypothetical protein